MVRNPKAMLMDEPIGSLDAKLREEMRVELKRVHVEQKATTIYVTHDQIEAMALADRIVVMHVGVLQQVGPPEEVYAKPVNLFVAQFVGSPVMNVAEVTVHSGMSGAQVTLAGAPFGFEFPAALIDQLQARGGAGKALSLGIRPEVLDIALAPTPGYIEAEVHSVEPLGSHDIIDLLLGASILRARTRPGFVPGPKARIFLRADPTRAHFFDTQTGNSLGIRL